MSNGDAWNTVGLISMNCEQEKDQWEEESIIRLEPWIMIYGLISWLESLHMSSNAIRNNQTNKMQQNKKKEHYAKRLTNNDLGK